VSAVLSSTLSVLGNLFFLLTLLFFMAFDTDSTRRSLAGLGNRMPDLAAALSSFARGARTYMGVTAGFGFIVAVIDGIALQLMGVPGAFVWAVLAFVTNFIPNIGFVIGVIPPAIIALLDGGPGLMIAVIVTYSVVNFLIQSVIQPRVVGDAVGLTALFTFMSLVFWTWLIGPLGALLAVPLTLLTRALLVETNPRFTVGTAADRGQSRGDREIGATPERSGWDKFEMKANCFRTHPGLTESLGDEENDRLHLA
jgi:AI-2 transport protein TqsA